MGTRGLLIGEENQTESQQIKSNQMLVFGVRENQSTQRKTFTNRVENQETQFTYDSGSGNQTHATLVEGECSHHYAKLTLIMLHHHHHDHHNRSLSVNSQHQPQGNAGNCLHSTEGSINHIQ